MQLVSCLTSIAGQVIYYLTRPLGGYRGVRLHATAATIATLGRADILPRRFAAVQLLDHDTCVIYTHTVSEKRSELSNHDPVRVCGSICLIINKFLNRKPVLKQSTVYFVKIEV
jgi:hypothetical protein